MENVKLKKRPIKLKNLSAGQRNFRIINLVLNAVLFLFTMGLLIYYIVTGDVNKRIMPCVGTMLFLIIPLAIELIFRTRITNIVYLMFLLYVLVAAVWGTSLNAYNNFPGLDKIVHFAFGYVGSLAGLYAICVLEDYNKLKRSTIIFVCFAVSMACGAVWEIMEFFSDTFLGQTAQGVPDANGVVSVLDTMLDICCNFGGAVIFIIHYFLHLLTKKGLGIVAMTSEFSKNPLVEKVEVPCKNSKKVKPNSKGAVQNNTQENESEIEIDNNESSEQE